MNVTVPSPRGYSGATLHLAIDPAEHERRQAFRTGHIGDRDVLNTLMSLPVGARVPWQNLTIHQQDSIRRAPAGAVRLDSDHMVVRLAVRPCRVALAEVRFATACATALDSASRFSPFCARQVVVRQRPTMPETLIEFGFYGVGVVLETDGVTETLVEPRPWRPMRHTPAGWWFTETAYAAWLAAAREHPERATA